MGISLTEQERQMIKEGKLEPSKIEEYRKEHPIEKPDKSEIERVKQDIRETNVLYKEAIQRNKDLYEELKENRKKKEELRNKIAGLRIRKKKLLGISK